jgi:hypothetical protein
METAIKADVATNLHDDAHNVRPRPQLVIITSSIVQNNLVNRKVRIGVLHYAGVDHGKPAPQRFVHGWNGPADLRTQPSRFRISNTPHYNYPAELYRKTAAIPVDKPFLRVSEGRLGVA